MKNNKKEPVSPIRKKYILRLYGRCIILTLCALVYIYRPEHFAVLSGLEFFKRLSPLHILWCIWMLDMLYQLFPIKKHIALGSQKMFAQNFKPIKEKTNCKALKKHIKEITLSAYKVFILWGLLLAGIGALYYTNVIQSEELFLISAVFYVCDLICVLIWCPFRLIMKNRCCTTCRIFNWDHLMMFTPMVFVRGFFTYSLIAWAFIVWLVWEIFVLIYPERFWENTNVALKCSECTDKLCTQYCKKLRQI